MSRTLETRKRSRSDEEEEEEEAMEFTDKDTENQVAKYVRYSPPQDGEEEEEEDDAGELAAWAIRLKRGRETSLDDIKSAEEEEEEEAEARAREREADDMYGEMEQLTKRLRGLNVGAPAPGPRSPYSTVTQEEWTLFRQTHMIEMDALQPQELALASIADRFTAAAGPESYERQNLIVKLIRGAFCTPGPSDRQGYPLILDFVRAAALGTTTRMQRGDLTVAADSIVGSMSDRERRNLIRLYSFFVVHASARAIWSMGTNLSRCYGAALVNTMVTRFGLSADPTRWVHTVRVETGPTFNPLARQPVEATHAETAHQIVVHDEYRGDGSRFTYNVPAQAAAVSPLFYLVTAGLTTDAPHHQRREIVSQRHIFDARFGRPDQSVFVHIPIRGTFPALASGDASIRCAVNASNTVERGERVARADSSFRGTLEELRAHQPTPPRDASESIYFARGPSDDDFLVLSLNTSLPTQHYDIILVLATGPSNPLFAMSQHIHVALAPMLERLEVRSTYCMTRLPGMHPHSVSAFPDRDAFHAHMFGALEGVGVDGAFDPVFPFLGRDRMPPPRLTADKDAIAVPAHTDWTLETRRLKLTRYAYGVWLHECAANPFLSLARRVDRPDDDPLTMLELMQLVVARPMDRQTMIAELSPRAGEHMTARAQLMYRLARRLATVEMVPRIETAEDTANKRAVVPQSFSLAALACRACGDAEVSHVRADGREAYCARHADL